MFLRRLDIFQSWVYHISPPADVCSPDIRPRLPAAEGGVPGQQGLDGPAQGLPEALGQGGTLVLWRQSLGCVRCVGLRMLLCGTVSGVKVNRGCSL